MSDGSATLEQSNFLNTLINEAFLMYLIKQMVDKGLLDKNDIKSALVETAKTIRTHKDTLGDFSKDAERLITEKFASFQIDESS